MKGLAVFAAILAILFLYGGLFAKKFYRPFWKGEDVPEDRIPSWLGRLIWLAGAVFSGWVAYGLWHQ